MLRQRCNRVRLISIIDVATKGNKMKMTIRFSLISAALIGGFFSTSAAAAKFTVNLTGQGSTLKCSAGYAAKGYACPSVVASAPTACPANWIGVPSMRIPIDAAGGTRVVPAFCVMKYVASIISGGVATSSETGAPAVNYTWDSMKASCVAGGGRILRDSEWMAIAHNIVNVDSNWTGGVVDSGDLKEGLQNAGASAQSAVGLSAPGRSRTLSTGETIWDIGGNVWQSVYGDMTGDSSVGTGGTIYEDRVASPYDSLTRGMGAFPQTLPKIFGSNLVSVRGGYWANASAAGPFTVGTVHPSSYDHNFSYRCAK